MGEEGLLAVSRLIHSSSPVPYRGAPLMAYGGT